MIGMTKNHNDQFSLSCNPPTIRNNPRLEISNNHDLEDIANYYKPVRQPNANRTNSIRAILYLFPSRQYTPEVEPERAWY